MSPSPDVPEIPATTLAAAAEGIAAAFGLGDAVATEDIWPVDDGDQVLAATFGGAFDGVLHLAVNTSVAARLSSDPSRLTAGFRSALAEISGALRIDLDVIDLTEHHERPVRIAQIRDNDQLCALFGVTLAADMPAEPEPEEGDGDAAATGDAAGTGSGGGSSAGTGGGGRAVAYAPADLGALRILQDVDVAVTVELGRTKMSVREVLALRPGMVIELDRSATAPIDMMVNGRHVACGDVVVIDEEFGIRITEIVARPSMPR